MAGPGDLVHAPVVESSWTDFESVNVSAPSEEMDQKKILYASKTLAGVTVQMEDYAPTFSARLFSREADEDHTESETPSRQAAPGASEPDPGG